MAVGGREMREEMAEFYRLFEAKVEEELIATCVIDDTKGELYYHQVPNLRATFKERCLS